MSSPLTEFDLAMMRRAISLGMRARGTAEPNPTVGCVIVKDGRVIGEGYTQPHGGAHAEPTALANCTESPAGATAYVTLEPCCHTNKKTPPCVPQVIAAGLKRVVVGTLDPYPAVNGQGIAQLRAAGIEVTVPALEAEAKQLHAPFIARVNFKRPYITLKWAETADGYVAGRGTLGLYHGKRLQISNPMSMRAVHELRGKSDAILVGAGTMRIDDPKLTPRDVSSQRTPIRVGLTGRQGLFANTNLLRTPGGPVVLYCSNEYFERRGEFEATRLRQGGVTVVPVPADADGLLRLPEVLTDLALRGVSHLIVEPGPTVGRSFFTAGHVDRVWRFRAPATLDEPGLAAPALPATYAQTGTIDLDGDVLEEWLNPASEVFFAPVESADFVRVRQSV